MGRQSLNCRRDNVYAHAAVVARTSLAPPLVASPYLCHSPAACSALPLLSVHLTPEMLNEF